ncbi:MAG: dethiobiotin synthase [Victivallaceae bacterium]
MAVYFITGIDTDTGKSYATGLLARYLLKLGKRVISQKLAQTGCQGISEDILLHRKLMGTELFSEDTAGLTCPYVFKFPASPHLAAELENKEINPQVITAATEKLQTVYDIVLLEGAGGLHVPLTRNYLTADYVQERGYPLLLVSSGRLGSINHTLLTLEAARNRGIRVAGIIYNLYPPADRTISMDSEKVMRAALKKYGFPEIIIEMPIVKTYAALPEIDFSPLFAGE